MKRFNQKGNDEYTNIHVQLAVHLLIIPSILFTGSNEHLRPPRITEHPADTVVRRNEPTKLDCRADGNPTPIIEWYKDGKKVSKTGNRMVLPTGSLFFLHVIQNKKDPDTGTYWCVARNEVGKATSRNATLNYACKFTETLFPMDDTRPLYSVSSSLRFLPKLIPK